MKQVIQNYQTGELKLTEVDLPQIHPSSLLVRTLYSAISAGTEKTKVDTAKMSLWQKAKSRPDLVKKVLQKAKKEGWVSTFQFVRKKLGEPIPLGYSLVGIVEEIGEWVEGIQVGDTVACAGAGFANHAEYNMVPHRLAVKVPPNTPLDQAAFTTIGAIALQGVRQADPKMGERFVVLGLGLIGQITSLLLKANGCFVLATDLDSQKLETAQKNRIAQETVPGNDPQLLDKVEAWSRGLGADGVLITASAADSGLMEQAGLLCREKGRVVVIGNVGTEFPRDIYYQKELDIRLSRSYGPGRYDPLYETLGLDYPAGFVRFTEQRNMEAFLDLLATRKIDLAPLLTHRFNFDEAEQAFALLQNKNDPYLGILLKYDSSSPSQAPQKPHFLSTAIPGDPLKIGFIGMGNYAASQLLPHLKKIPGVEIEAASTATGLKSFEKEGSDKIGTIFIATRHDSHAGYVTEALRQNKNVFVEKPLCLDREELDSIRQSYENSRGLLCVGFNRRFAPLIQEIKTLFPQGADHILCRVNAGKLKSDHWLNIPEIGGGRLLGEVCHFIDLAGYLAASPIQKVFAKTAGRGKKSPQTAEDFHILLECENGALASIVYFSGGHSELSKEYLEVHGKGASALLKDFQSLEINGETKQKILKQDKGQFHMLKNFLAACQKGQRNSAPIPAQEIWNSCEAAFCCLESLAKGKPISIKGARVAPSNG